MTRTLFRETLALFLPVAAGLVLLAGVAYVNDQQILREGANEPQIWMAADAARALANPLATTTAYTDQVSIAESLAPYLVFYDAAGNPLAGTGYLHGQLPTVPLGIFEYARSMGQNALTWQPETGVRQAVVVVPIRGGDGGFVLAGRSLAYVEKEEGLLTDRSALGLLVALAGAFGVSLSVAWSRRRFA